MRLRPATPMTRWGQEWHEPSFCGDYPQELLVPLSRIFFPAWHFLIFLNNKKRQIKVYHNVLFMSTLLYGKMSFYLLKLFHKLKSYKLRTNKLDYERTIKEGKFIGI